MSAGATVATVAVVLVAVAGVNAVAAAVVNPLRPVAPDDVDLDPSHGFLVLVEGDAELNENETEGPVAIGGDVRFRDYGVGLNNPGTYVLPGDTQPTSLVVDGAVDFAGSAQDGSLTTLNSYAKIGDLTNADVLPSGGATFVVPNGGDTNTRPAVIVNTSEPADSVAGDSGFDLASLFATYRDISADMFSCPSTVMLRDQNGQEEWSGTDPNATIGLQPGQNVLTLTGDQLNALDNVNPLSGGLQPSEEAWLVINVVVEGDYSFAPPNVSWQGNEPSRHVLWNFITSGTVTLPESSGTVWGTLYAPSAELVDLSSSNIEGAVVARTAVMGGTTTGSGGEIHYAPFENIVTTCESTPPTTTTTTTDPTTTTEPTTTTTTEPTTTELSTTTTTDGATVPTVPTGDDGGNGTDLNGNNLPDTGASPFPFLIAGGVLIGAGTGALMLTRRRATRSRNPVE